MSEPRCRAQEPTALDRPLFRICGERAIWKIQKANGKISYRCGHHVQGLRGKRGIEVTAVSAGVKHGD